MVTINDLCLGLLETTQTKLSVKLVLFNGTKLTIT
jgi:hypothetical protein